MQRRDARTFLEEVLKGADGISDETRDKLLAAVADKPGPKRAAKLASVLVTAAAQAAEAAPPNKEPRRG
jgi:hypothetical protein